MCFTYDELTQLSGGDGSSTKTNFAHMECAAYADGVKRMIGRWDPAKHKGGIPTALTSIVAEKEVVRAADLKCTVCLEGNATIGCVEVRVFCGKTFQRIIVVIVTIPTTAANGNEVHLEALKRLM